MDKGIREFLDSIMNTANAVTETVTGVTKEGAKLFNSKKEAARLNMEVLRVRASIEEMQKSIGRESYEIYKTADELEAEEHQVRIDELLEEIDGKYDLILQLTRQIEILNGGQVCPSCSKISPASFDFCPSCGARLVKNTAASSADSDSNGESVDADCECAECCGCGTSDEECDEDSVTAGCDCCKGCDEESVL